jgi:hypothetical protein
MNRAFSGDRTRDHGVTKVARVSHSRPGGDQLWKVSHPMVTALVGWRTAWVGRFRGSDQLTNRFLGESTAVCSLGVKGLRS